MTNSKIITDISESINYFRDKCFVNLEEYNKDMIDSIKEKKKIGQWSLIN